MFNNFQPGDTKFTEDENRGEEKMRKWVSAFIDEAKSRKASQSLKNAVEGAALEELARSVFEEMREKAMT